MCYEDRKTQQIWSKQPGAETTQGETTRPETSQDRNLTGSAVITHDATTGTGYCLVGLKWIIIIFFYWISQSDT